MPPEQQTVEQNVMEFVSHARRPTSVIDIVAMGSTARTGPRDPDQYRRATLRLMDRGLLNLEQDLTVSVRGQPAR